MIKQKFQKLSKETQDSAIYLFFSVGGYGVSFLQNFIFAWLVSMSFYGEITLAYSLFTLSMAVFMFGLSTSVTKFYFEKENFTTTELISHVSISWLIVGVILMSLILGVILSLYSLFSVEIISLKTVIVLVLAGFFYSYFEMISSLFPAQKKPIKYGFYLLSNRLIIFAAVLIAIIAYPEDILAIAYGYLIGSGLIFLSGIITFIKYYTFNVQFEKVIKILKFSAPLALNTIGNIGFNQGFKILIAPFISFSELGVFDLAGKLANVSYLIGTSVSKGNLAKAYDNLQKTNTKESIDFYKKLLLKISLISGVTIFVLGIPFLVIFKNGDFFEAIYLLPFLLIGQTVLMLYSYYYVYLSHSNKTRYITYSVILGALSSLALAYLFVVILDQGIIGAACSTLVGYLVQILTAKKYSNKI